MDPTSGSFYLGRWFGINVRVHFTFLIFAAFRVYAMVGVWKSSAAVSGGVTSDFIMVLLATGLVVGMFLSVLFHEFGHSLSCRFFRGQADEILMWPLGGLAFCRPPFHPTAHLITTACGPLVTLVIWLLLGVALPLYQGIFFQLPESLFSLLYMIGQWNYFILLFNLLPAFPMDGGRLLRDTLWHVTGYRPATVFAIWLGRIVGFIMVMAGFGLLPPPIMAMLPSIFSGGFWMIIIGAFVLFSNSNIERTIAIENAGASGYSLKDHMKHAQRQSKFRKQMSEIKSVHLHECVSCQRTEVSHPSLEFRVSSLDDQEYCLEHLPRPQAR